jgi:hypothetical protein
MSIPSKLPNAKGFSFSCGMKCESLTSKLMNVAASPITIGIKAHVIIANHWPYFTPSFVANDTPVKYSATSATTIRIDNGAPTAPMTP